MKGLTTAQAKELLKQHGLNIIVEQQKKNILIKFFEQFKDFLILLLIIAAGFSFFAGDRIDGFLILSIVILNALFGLFQEKKAEEAIEALKKMTISKIRVIRDGKEMEIDSRHLVPGDIIHIEQGVKIPADGKLVEAKNIEINEAALTGESFPIAKEDGEEVFMGTVVSRGRAYVEILKTGMNTKFGEIAAQVSAVERVKTPLQKKLEGLSRLIGIIGILLALLVFAMSFLQGATYSSSFLLAVSLAVAVVPEGLPAVMTITLAIGVKEMAKRKAIMRKLSAIEALGSVTLIATDKTGTLTSNEMDATEIFINGLIFKEDKFPAKTDKTFSKLLLNATLCSTASLVYSRETPDKASALGDPTEGALLVLAKEQGLDPNEVRQDWEIISEQPFDSVTKRMTVVVKKNNGTAGGQTLTFTKGAPEVILEISDTFLSNGKTVRFTPTKKKEVEKALNGWARQGYRILAFSYAEGDQIKTKKTKQIFIGMVALHDPPRPEVKEALRKTKEAGIKVVMITGDNELTSASIATSLGLMKRGDEIMTGDQLDKYTDEELLKILPRIKVFARTTPIHKQKIVMLYQKLGETVAVTGDGVNDVVALKQADVGIAMGQIGTDVARETADMVIMDDNFATIVNAIEEGRNIVKNLKGAVTYLLTGNFSEATSLIGGLSFGITHLFFPIQILYINFVSDGLPALSLAFSPRDPQAMRRPPSKITVIVDSVNKKFIFIVGLLTAFIVLSSYFLFAKAGEGVGRTAAFSVLAICQGFILIPIWLSHQSIRHNLKKLFSPLFLFAFLFPFVGQYLIVSISQLAHAFRSQLLSPLQYLQLALLSSLILVGVKVTRRLIKR